MVVIKEITIDEFDQGKDIGRGDISKVYEATHKPTKTKVAIKRIDKAFILGDEKALQQLIEKLFKLQNPKGLGHHRWFKDAKHFYLVSKCATHGSLRSMMVKDPFDSQKSAHCVKLLAKALMHYHKHDLIHGNLKPENLLYGDNGDLKVIDHGLYKYSPNTIKAASSDKRSYIAPELALGKSYGSQVDNWSLGIILFELVTGKHPMSLVGAGNYDKVKDLVKKQDISEHLKDLLYKLLDVDPKSRLSLNGVLHHPWLLKYTGGKYAVCKLV